MSDRRVVWVDGTGKVTRQHDGYIKAVITPAFACSYTGIADFGATDTAEWLAITLSDHINDADDGIRGLATAVKQGTDTPRYRGRALAIVCAGWVQRESAVVPKLTLIDKSATNTFNMTSIDVAQWRMSCVVPAGQRLHQEELTRVNRDVENLCKSDRDTARAIAQVLTETIRRVARSPDRGALVSEEVLITSLPARPAS